ncbi:isoflavone reductase family protein-like protein CipA [Cadophora sp. MPI-SDFR-AT-0126]|nr:isoflavone reductase family protein-like protein CipA [Leotiomycetes sp. MPI-SDFR-AT-0126]
MSTIKNIAVLGGSRTVGAPVLKAIIDSGEFNITVITRPSSTSTFPSGVKVIRADPTAVDELTTALKGQDAVVSTVAREGVRGQTVLVDAAIAAGVKRILPSEYAGDLDNPKAATLPPFADKIHVRKYIEAKVAAGADITYSYVVSSIFLDWGLDYEMLLEWRSPKPPLYNGGEFDFSTTTLATVGKAVVGVLSHPEETKNRSVYVHDIAISQKKLLELARKVAPDRNWLPVTVSLDEKERWLKKKAEEGDYTSRPVIFGYLGLAVFQDGYGGRLPQLDNELLGIKEMTEADIEALWRERLISK